MPQRATDRRVDSVCSVSLLSAQEALISTQPPQFIGYILFSCDAREQRQNFSRHPQHFSALGMFAAPSFYMTIFSMDFFP